MRNQLLQIEKMVNIELKKQYKIVRAKLVKNLNKQQQEKIISDTDYNAI